MLVPFLSIITKIKNGLISEISSALDYFCGPQHDSSVSRQLELKTSSADWSVSVCICHITKNIYNIFNHKDVAPKLKRF